MKARIIDIMLLDAVAALLVGVAIAVSGCGTGSHSAATEAATEIATETSTEASAEESGTETSGTDASVPDESTEDGTTTDADGESVTNGVTSIKVYTETSYEARLGDDNKVLVSVSHPTVGVGEDTGYAELRDALDLATTTMKESATAAADEYEQYAKDAIKDGYWIDGAYYSYQMTAQMTRSDSVVVSFLVTDYANRGGVHPDTWYETYNYDAQTGERLMIHDVLQDGQYEGLAERLAAALNEKYGANTFYDSDVQTLLQQDVDQSNEFQFTLGQQGITFYFAPYNLAPYVCGTQYVTFSYVEVPELVKEAYTQAPTDYITVITDRMDAKVNGADGTVRSLSMTTETTEDDVYTMTLSLDGNEFKDDGFYSLGTTPYLVHVDGRNYLYLELIFDNDWKAICVYDLNGDAPVLVGSVDRGFRNSGLCDPNEMELATRTYLLSTNECFRTYKVGDDGLPVATMDYDRIVGTASEQLTTKSEMTVSIRDTYDGESADETLPAGTVLIFYATDDESWVDFMTEDGRFVRIENISIEEWPYTVDGVDAETLFDGMVYAG